MWVVLSRYLRLECNSFWTRFVFQVSSSLPKNLVFINAGHNSQHTINKWCSKFPISIHFMRAAHEKMCSFFRLVCCVYLVHCFELQWKRIEFIQINYVVRDRKFIWTFFLSFCISTRKRLNHVDDILCCRFAFRTFFNVYISRSEFPTPE